jgi:hypothetical protein
MSWEDFSDVFGTEVFNEQPGFEPEFKINGRRVNIMTCLNSGSLSGFTLEIWTKDIGSDGTPSP